MRVRILWVVGLVCALLVVTMSATLSHRVRLVTAQAAQRPAPEGSRTSESGPLSGNREPDGTIHLNFRNADILQMVTLMSELTGKNFLLDDKVRGKVTLIAPRPVTPAEAYQIFLAALAMQGFTVVPQGPINKILPSRDAKTSPLPTVTDTARPPR